MKEKLEITPSRKQRNNFIKVVFLIYLAPVFKGIALTLNIENSVIEFIIWWIPSLIAWKIASDIYYD